MMKRIVLLVFLLLALNATSNVDGGITPSKNESNETIEISTITKVESTEISLYNWIESRDIWERNSEVIEPIEEAVSLEDWVDSREIWEQKSEPDLLKDWIESRESWEQ